MYHIFKTSLNGQILSQLLGHGLEDLLELVQLGLHALDLPVARLNLPLQRVDQRVALLDLLLPQGKGVLEVPHGGHPGCSRLVVLNSKSWVWDLGLGSAGKSFHFVLR